MIFKSVFLMINPNISWQTYSDLRKDHAYCVGLEFRLGRYETYSHGIEILRPRCIHGSCAASHYDLP